LKKSAQKTFGPLRAPFGPMTAQTPREADQKFFGGFFFKESSPYLRLL
jgi:hypothetical protein